MANKPRINRADGPFNSYANTSVAYLDAVDSSGVANWQRLGLSSAQRNGWAARRNTWNTAYAIYGNAATRTKSAIDNKNDAKFAFIAFVQPLLNIIAASPAITNDDYAAFNIKKRDTQPTARGKITTSPFAKLLPMGGGQVKVVVRMDDDESRPSMNPLADSIEIHYTIGTVPPVSEEETTNSMSYRRAQRIFKLGQNKAGQRMYAFFRWQNETNDEKSGPWSTLEQTVIA